MIASVSPSVLILGAGLTGLTIAHHLCQQRYHVTLLNHPEWRDGFWLNPSVPGPILLGCHRESRRLLHTLARQEPSTPDQPIPLAFRLPDGREAIYQSARLPGAFQWMMSLFSFQGLAWHDRWRLFSHVEQIWEQAETLPVDLENRTAQEWLTATGQSPEAQARIWGPLAQWLTGNEMAKLSAATFVQLLSTVFLSDASDARLTALSGTVEQTFMAPMRQLLSRDHVELRALTQRPHLRFGEHGLRDISLPDGTTLQAQWYIIALSHQELRGLLPERLLTRFAYFAHLTELKDLGEVVIHVTCQGLTQPPRLVLLPGRPFRQLTVTPSGPGAIICRLTGTADSFTDQSHDQLLDTAMVELNRIFPNLGPKDTLTHEILREHHAALSLAPGTARLRPLQQGPIPNMLIAGAWTDTGWPANLESALVSARRCAETVVGRPY